MKIKVFLVILLLITFCNANEHRIALVIGNKNYINNPLKNSINDAHEIAKVLEDDLDFEVVFGTDVTQSKFNKLLEEFKSKITTKSRTFFYFSGHGSPLSENDPEVFLQMIEDKGSNKPSLTSIYKLYAMLKEANAETNILCLDACRKYIKPVDISKVSPNKRSIPYKTIQRAQKMKQDRKSYSSDLPLNIIISYAANYKSQALDYINKSDKHSPYAKYLIKHLADEGVPIHEVFRQVRIGMTNELGMEEAGFIEIHSNIYPYLNSEPKNSFGL